MRETFIQLKTVRRGESKQCAATDHAFCPPVRMHDGTILISLCAKCGQALHVGITTRMVSDQEEEGPSGPSQDQQEPAPRGGEG